MKKLILSELLLLFLATTFVTDSPPPGWYQQTLPVSDQINDIFFLDSLTGWVVTNSNLNPPDSGYILKTTDGGNNWVIQNTGLTRFNVVQFLNSDTGYAGAEVPTAEVYKSTNGGNNWYVISSMLTGLTDLFFVNNDTGWYCEPSSFGGIFKTTNGGTSWIPQAGSSYRPQKLFFINSDTGWAGSNEANPKLYRTINGGTNWSQQYIFVGSGVLSMYFQNGLKGFAGGGGSPNIQYTTNGGFNWSPSQGEIGGYDIKFVNDSVGWAGGGSQPLRIIKSTDGGRTWGYQTAPATPDISVATLRNDTLLAWAGRQILIHTMDGGGPITFTGIHKISSEIPNEFVLYQNFPNPFNPNTNIKYQVVKSSHVILKVFSIQGKEITELVNQKLNPGTYEVTFDGSGLSSGVYFYSLMVDGKLVETRKMILLR